MERLEKIVKQEVEICEIKKMEQDSNGQIQFGNIYCLTCGGKNYLCEYYVPAIKYED